jgi:hypothetical protein
VPRRKHLHARIVPMPAPALRPRSAVPTYHGSCHCGNIRFEIDAVIDRVTVCNCSICTKKGVLHHRVPRQNFRLLTGAQSIATYRFGTRVAQHYYCPDCGIHVFARPCAAPHLYTVNVCCLDDLDLATAKLEMVPFDGRNWEPSVHHLE